MPEKNANYKNFWESLPTEEWTKLIHDFFISQSLTWKKQIIYLNWKDIRISLKNLDQISKVISPWSRTISVTLNLEIENKLIPLTITSEITSPIDYQIITDSFIKKISNFEINYQSFVKDIFLNKKIIANQIIDYFDSSILIDKNLYKVDLSDLQVLNYQIKDINSHYFIELKITSKHVNPDGFNVILKLNNYQLEAFLKNRNKNEIKIRSF